jgi:hypothetical protein
MLAKRRVAACRGRRLCNGHQLTREGTSRCSSGLLIWLSSSWPFRMIPAEGAKSYWNSRIVLYWDLGTFVPLGFPPSPL